MGQVGLDRMGWGRLEWMGQSGQDEHDRTGWDRAGRDKMGQMGWVRADGMGWDWMGWNRSG